LGSLLSYHKLAARSFIDAAGSGQAIVWRRLQLLLQITFRNMAQSDSMEAQLREMAKNLNLRRLDKKPR
jgi:hypothetical protein